MVAPGNQGLIHLPPGLTPDTAGGLALLNAEVSRQAALIGYVGDFSIMMIVTLLTIPLLLLIRRPGTEPNRPVAEVPH